MTALPHERPVLPSHVLGMYLLIAAEIMFFAGLISALLVARANQTVWSVADQPRLPVLRTAMNTALLLVSGLTIREAWRASREDGWSRQVSRWLLATVALGATFVALQGREWARLLHHGITATTSQASGFFYLIVGAHGAHAVAGLLLLSVVTLWSRSPRLLQAATIYWAFVVLLWPILYVLVYLT